MSGKGPSGSKITERLEKKVNKAGARLEADIAMAEEMCKKAHPALYSEFVKFNRTFIRRRIFFFNQLESINTVHARGKEILEGVEALEQPFSKIIGKLTDLLKKFDKNKAAAYTLKEISEELKLLCGFSQKQEELRLKSKALKQELAEIVEKFKQFIKDYQGAQSQELKSMQAQAEINYKLFGSDYLKKVLETFKNMEKSLEADLQRLAGTIQITEQVLFQDALYNASPDYQRASKMLKDNVEKTIQEMTTIQAKLRERQLTEENARRQAEQQSEMQRRKQIESLVVELEAALQPSAEESVSSETAFKQYLQRQVIEARENLEEFNLAKTVESKLHVFFKHFSLNKEEFNGINLAAIEGVVARFYKSREQCLDDLMRTINTTDLMQGAEYIYQSIVGFFQKFQESFSEAFLQKEVLPSAQGIASALLRSMIKNKKDIAATFERVVLSKLSSFKTTLQQEKNLFIESPAYQKVQENPALKAASIVKEIEVICASSQNSGIDASPPRAQLLHLFDMRAKLRTLRQAGTPMVVSEASPAFEPSLNMSQHSLEPSFEILIPRAFHSLNQNPKFLEFLDDLKKGTVCYSQLTAFIEGLGGECEITANNHVIYSLPNIWERVTNIILTLGLPHGQGPNSDLDILDLNVLGSIRRQFNAAGLKADLVARAMEHFSEQSVLSARSSIQ